MSNNSKIVDPAAAAARANAEARQQQQAQRSTAANPPSATQQVEQVLSIRPAPSNGGKP